MQEGRNWVAAAETNENGEQVEDKRHDRNGAENQVMAQRNTGEQSGYKRSQKQQQKSWK